METAQQRSRSIIIFFYFYLDYYDGIGRFARAVRKDTSMRVVACKNEHARQLDYVLTGSFTSRRFKLEFLKWKLRLIEEF